MLPRDNAQIYSGTIELLPSLYGLLVITTSSDADRLSSCDCIKNHNDCREPEGLEYS
jgi:hypothetical protein